MNKKKLYPLLLLMLFICNNIYTQQYKKFNFDTDVDSLLKVYPNGFAVFFGALWCGPCIGKSKPISDYFSKEKRDYGFICVYDPYKFSKENGERLLKERFTNNQNFILSNEFYTSKGLIQINPQNKAINNIKKKLTQFKLVKGNLTELGFGELLFFSPQKELSILNLAYNANVNDTLIHNFLGAN